MIPKLSNGKIINGGEEILACGPWGIQFKAPGVLSPANLIRFTCFFCGKTTSGAGNAHHDGCEHPGIHER